MSLLPTSLVPRSVRWICLWLALAVAVGFILSRMVAWTEETRAHAHEVQQ